jgi:hypothetical protein
LDVDFLGIGANRRECAITHFLPGAYCGCADAKGEKMNYPLSKLGDAVEGKYLGYKAYPSFIPYRLHKFLKADGSVLQFFSGETLAAALEEHAKPGQYIRVTLSGKINAFPNSHQKMMRNVFSVTVIAQAPKEKK